MQEVTVRLNKYSRSTEKKLIFPTNWNELTPKQLLYISKNWRYWKQLSSFSINMRLIRARLILELCGLKTWFAKKKLAFMLSFVDDKTGVNILQLSDFIFQEIKLTKNILPRLRVGLFTWYYGPADKLNDISIDEFSFAYHFYNQYTRTGKEIHLNYLVACLYRPKNKSYLKDGELKLPFTNNLIEEHARKINRLSSAHKQAVYLYFMGNMEYLGHKYGRIFRRASKNEQNQVGSFNDTVMELSGSIFGDHEKTKRTNAHLIFKHCEKLIEKNSNKKK